MRWQPASRPLARVRCHKAQPPMFGDLAGNVVRGLILLLWKRRVLRLRWIKLPRSWNEPRCGECHQRDHIHHSSRLSPARCGGAREQSATGNGQMLMGERHVRSARAARQTSSERCSGERRRERWCAPQARSFFRWTRRVCAISVGWKFPESPPHGISLYSPWRYYSVGPTCREEDAPWF